MKDIEWRDGSLPVSTRFDDPYYSREDGRAETDYVFIKGNRLHKRWPTMEHCTIAELGFGTGLNFLETTRQWLELSLQGAALHFISFEQFPIVLADLEKALSHWPELLAFSEILLSVWDTRQTVLDTMLFENVRLTIHFGDANEILPDLDFAADAWFLDGFSPAKNPELWNEKLMSEVAKRCVAKGTFATYTAAGFVRRNLADAGFFVEKTKGFGKKRDMLRGIKQNDIDVAGRH